jgi:hypothetical protein
MRTNLSLGIAAVVIIIASVSAYILMKPVPAKAPGITLPAGGYSEHAQYYDITADYATSTPLLASAGALADATARSLIYGFVRDTIQQFKADGNFANLTQKDIEMLGLDKGRKETLKIVYLQSSSPHTLTYIYTIYLDTLGAHGNMFFKTFVFDSATGKPLTLTDLFIPGTNYLEVLSKLARAKLPAIIGDGADASFIAGGTTPEEKNFANFFFDNKDFGILFAPYAVAPYAAGPQTLRIKLSELSSILKPAYR